MKPNFSLRSEAAFNLTELCVVLGCFTVLCLLVLPSLASSKGNSKALQCMENTRRLTLAWRMYAEDNSDNLVLSSDDGTAVQPYGTTISPAHVNNLYAWTWSHLDFNGANAWNWDTNADITLRPLWPYVKDTTVYKCPSDISTVTVSGASAGNPITNGSIVPRVRSYSMNFYLGGYAANNALTYDGGHGWAKYFPVYTNLTQLGNFSKSPGPSQTFVFIDERSDTISWGNFQTDMYGYPLPIKSVTPVNYEWSLDLPASYHNYAACLSFADGHAEIHRWRDATTMPPLAPNGSLLSPFGGRENVPAPYGVDVPYMQNISARPH